MIFFLFCRPNGVVKKNIISSSEWIIFGPFEDNIISVYDIFIIIIMVTCVRFIALREDLLMCSLGPPGPVTAVRRGKDDIIENGAQTFSYFRGIQMIFDFDGGQSLCSQCVRLLYDNIQIRVWDFERTSGLWVGAKVWPAWKKNIRDRIILLRDKSFLKKIII